MIIIIVAKRLIISINVLYVHRWDDKIINFIIILLWNYPD